MLTPAARHASATTAHDGALGPLLRHWRSQRRRSQLDLALDVGISARHLSFIETGRSRPSAQVLMQLAAQLDLPLRERNRLLLAAGYAPRYAERDFEAESMAPVRQALQRLLDAHHPYPGIVLDRRWNVVMSNAAAHGLTGLLSPALAVPPLNIFRVSLHPEGMAAHTSNFAEWGSYMLDALHRSVLSSDDEVLRELEREVRGYPNVAALLAQADTAADTQVPALLVPCVLELPVGRLSMFTTLTTFGTARDVTLDELSVEMFYPSDAASEALLRAMGGAASGA
jgi:transcriptional regulator with XRE-family HTH domain